MSPLGFASLVACTDGLADGDYRGEVMFTMSGVVRAPDDTVELPDDEIRVGLFWEPGDLDDDIEMGPALGLETTFPARYALSVYAPPAEGLPASLGTAWLGAPLLWIDDDGDGRYHPDHDTLAGGSQGLFVIYTAEGYTPEAPGEAPPGDTGEPPTGDEAPPTGDPETFDPGFHVVSFAGGCTDSPATAEDPDAVDLYVARTTDDLGSPPEDCAGP